ncbi:hypothetical protein ACWD6P_28460 [Streptomyces sp. NPDC002446]
MVSNRPPRRSYELPPSGRIGLKEFKAVWLHFRDAVDPFLANWPETAVKTPTEPAHPLMKSCLSAAARETATAFGEEPPTSFGEEPPTSPAGRGRTLALVGLAIVARSA